MASYGNKPDQTQNLLSVRTWEFKLPARTNNSIP
jgi:hypothetical protein